MQRLSDVEIFLAVVEARSFSRAARRLGRSQPAMSRAVAALETRLGVRLLDRTTRRMRLTEAGAAYAARCRDALEALRAAETDAREAASALRGRVRISAPPTFARIRLGPLLADLAAAHPRIETEWVLSDRNVDLGAEGFDAAIRLGSLPDSSLAARRIARERNVLCASPAHLARDGVPTRVEDLARRNCLVLAGDRVHAVARFRVNGALRRIPLTGNLASNDLGLLHEAARAGLGIAVLPSWLVADDLRTGALTELLPRARLAPIDVWALVAGGRAAPQRVRVVVDFLVERLRGAS
jgi:DNA-binding transcriptional LysR family regulator